MSTNRNQDIKFKHFALANNITLGERIVTQPNLIGDFRDDDLVFSKKCLRSDINATQIFAKSMSFDTAFRGLSVSLFDGTITGITVLGTIADGVSTEGVESMELISNEAIEQLDVYEGESGLAIKVGQTFLPHTCCNLSRYTQIEAVRGHLERVKLDHY